MKKLFTIFLVFSLVPLMTTCSFMEKTPPKDYLPIMLQAAAEGNVELGRLAEECRNGLIHSGQLREKEISFDQLYLLAKYIYAESGEDWLTDEYRLCTGEIIMNRLASPEFPDTLEEVIFLEGPYAKLSADDLANPSRPCVEAALRLLKGERMMAPQVVFKSDVKLGEVYATYSDYMLGYTYFCESFNPQLYAQKNAAIK